MSNRISIRAAVALLLVAATGCQDYNFNPVGHCLIQPGTRRVTLSDVSTADVLFVVDDSGSMAGEQTELANQFSAFMDVLATANQERIGVGLEPIDFHIAVTTTATYYNEPPAYGSVCTDQCPGALGSKVCCLRTSLANPAPKSPQPPLCRTDADCSGGNTCRTDCVGGADVFATPGTGTWKACCAPAVPHTAQTIACATVGEECGNFDPNYYFDGTCDMSYVDDAVPASPGATNYRYPAGHFMAPAGNDKVLHFTKVLDWANWGTDPALNALATDFGENVRVGTCGSAQEQGLEAARRAIKGVLGRDGLTQPDLLAGEFLHDKAKLVVVWVTDEDDCSGPYSGPEGVVFSLSGGCAADAALPEGEQRQHRLAEYADFFTSLGRPFGAAFIASANNGCEDQSCFPQICVQAGCSTPPEPPGTCGGQGVPNRYLDLAAEFRGRGADVVVGSICDPFGTTLGRIADIVKPPTGLTLPTQPAASELTILRITRADGTTRKTCAGPAPEAMTAAEAEAAGYDWWFTATRDQVTATQRDPVQVSQYVYINHATNNCEANPGETYSADYLGQLPQGGCVNAADCADALGGDAGQWLCDGYVAGVRNGTCVCN